MIYARFPLRAIDVSLFIVFFTVAICYGQNSAEESYNKGLDHLVQGKFEEAKEEFEKALKYDPHDRSSKETLKHLKYVVEQKIEKEAAIYFFKGISYFYREMAEEAITEYNKTINLAPNFADAYNNRGYAYFVIGQNDRAISDYNEAIKINSRLAHPYNNRGLAYHVQGQYNRAISDYSKAIEIDPTIYEIYNNRGYAYRFC